MQRKLFISYSRHQTPFVDRFAAQLEKSGSSIWLDYQRLIPARPWMEQISSGVAEAEIVLLIVSGQSIASKNVEPEWRHAIQLKKRIILVIFEATPLPAELQACEWVDFRGSYRKSFQRLKSLIDGAQAEVKSAAPQSGFKASLLFWIVMLLSLFVLIGSIPAWWTILIPYILVPLPWKIYKRNYIFSQVIPVLLILPICITFSASFFGETGVFHNLQPLYILLLRPTFFTSWLLLLLLFTPSIQRRVLPQAARVRFASPLKVDLQQPRSMSFAIDHAAEDVRYAEDLTRGLEKHGHRLAADGEAVEASFVLISTYKNQSKYDPDHQVLYPIVLQKVDEIEPALQRIQWIDFRNGVKHIDKLAKLLPEPERLLRALAVPPTGAQEIFPLAVNALQYFFLFTGVVGFGGLLISIFSFAASILSGTLAVDQAYRLTFAGINGILLIISILYALRGLRTRRHGTAAIYPLLVLAVFQMVIYFTNVSILAYSDGTDQALVSILTSISIGSILTFLAVPFALLIVLPIVLLRWSELSRWFPRRQGLDVDRVEQLFLLYSPLNLRVFLFQFIFHLAFLLFYLFVFVVFQVADVTDLLSYALPMFLVILFLRWLAVRTSQE